MAKYRADFGAIMADLDTYLMSDAGLETVLMFERGIELPEFAAFTLLRDDTGKKIIRDYYGEYVRLAKSSEPAAGSVLYTPTYRANPDWAKKLGIEEEELISLNKLAVKEMFDLREEHEDAEGRFKVLVTGGIGPRGDGFVADTKMTPEEAESYHELQTKAFADAGVDLITTMTITYTDEAIGAVRAAKKHSVPCVVGFTVETDGSMPSGMTLKEAIEIVDAATDGGPAHYMITCAHPTHFMPLLKDRAPWTKRIGEVRCNASSKSHTELDESPTLDRGDPVEYGKLNGQLRKMLPGLKIFGGCCGTNGDHLMQLAITLRTIF